MHIGILTIGDELTSGRTRDVNGSAIARLAYLEGWSVSAMLSVGDREGDIREALDYLLARSDAILTTGGLGPTADDKTTAILAEICGLALYTDEAVLARIKARFEQFRLRWTENNTKQATFPEGAEIVPNAVGMAPGFALSLREKVLIALPGVPSETARMLPDEVMPLLRRRFPAAAKAIATRTFKTFGLSEALVDESLAPLALEERGVAVGFYPNFPENHIVLTVREDTPEAAQAKLAAAEDDVLPRLGTHVFARDAETLEGAIARLLTERGLTLTVAESCSGGLITDRLTDVPGSSAFLDRALVTYSNAAKTDLLGVPEALLREHGAVSEAVARRMAEGARQRAGTSLGLASTGIAGPAGGSEDKPVGTVHVALADGETTYARQYAFRWDRRRNKVITSQAALMLLRRYLTGEPLDG